jgi:hypothetical protein
LAIYLLIFAGKTCSTEKGRSKTKKGRTHPETEERRNFFDEKTETRKGQSTSIAARPG